MPGPSLPDILVTYNAPVAGPSLIETLLPFIVILAIFYFLIWRPQSQKARRHDAMVAALKKDDKVVTQSGLHGRVIEVHPDTVVLDVGGKTRLTFDKKSVARKADEANAAEAAK